jgi:hypothetical protein
VFVQVAHCKFVCCKLLQIWALEEARKLETWYYHLSFSASTFNTLFSCWPYVMLVSPLQLNPFFFFLNSWKGKIFLHCWVFPYRVPWIHYACCWTCSCKQQGKTCPVRSFSFVILAFLSSVIWGMHVQVFMMNLSAPFICEFFKDVQEKALP